MKKQKKDDKKIKKKDKKDSKEESELEKEIEEIKLQESLEKLSDELIENDEFPEFIKQSAESFSTVLEKIETPRESLEKNVGSAPIIQEKKDDKLKDYSAISNEPNYSATEKTEYQINTEPGILKSTEISKDLQRQELLNPLTRIETTQNNLMPKMIDTEFIKESPKFPFEKDDKKYKEFRI